MARITVEDCLTKETNRFALVQLAAKRTKQILHGAKVALEEKRDNKAVVTALREIAVGKVRFMTAAEVTEMKEREAELAAQNPQIPQVDPLTAALAAAAASQALAAAATAGDDDDDDSEDGEPKAKVPSRNGESAF